ncbi:uncharacterized protein CCOS01_04725 [Colletotrichum costaricense]|uniref:PNPLA domain-containing protein n=1 Tax=Colletotrichum costaricense TaxID=1209916 RepID=A0AAJ0E369_9PEZI|nr:uncharacterized protein CCOS01_04725 [Colletotrichum costaricense]KAK1532742.1 hypothetical protein CCOS01_04725 [Colletotrichum costaricense]
MLGRMGMSTEEAINAYESFAKDVFRKKNRRRWWNRTYKEETLVKIIQDNVTKKKLAKTTMLDDTREKGLAFVCSATYDAYEAYLFRTYKGSSNCAHNVEIWEAARATSAAPTFFHPISIEVESERDQYVDGAVTYNNPARLVLSEAESYFGPRRTLGFLLSLGTGLKVSDKKINVVPQGQLVDRPVVARQGSGALFSRGTIKILKHAKASLTDSEPEHQALEQRFQKTNYAYWRLNLDRGAADIKLNEYKKMGLLRAATEKYLQDIEVSTNIDKIVSMLHKKEGVNLSLDAACHAVSDAASKQALQQEVQINSIASPQFTGRLDILNKMERHFYKRPSGSSPRRHLRIWGMGGVGKTQIVLRFRDLYGSRFDRVFWINAATEDSIFESFRLLTAEIFDEEASKPNIKRVQNWLAQNQTEEWLLVFDNNDTIDVSHLLPPGNTGNILFTSRRKDMSPTLDADQTFPVDIMDAEDAITLFLRASKRQKTGFGDDEDRHARAIVHELGYLPLAIDQAGSYIYNQECSFEDYFVAFRKGRKDILGDPMYPGVFEHNPAVYGTFELSYVALEKLSLKNNSPGRAALNALRILNIFCFYHNEKITSAILGRAAISKRKNPDRLRGEGGDNGIGPLPLLNTTGEGDWDPTNFENGIATLRSYSLIKRSALVGWWYSMHVLVHSWARDRMKPTTLAMQRRAAGEILYLTILRNNSFDSELFRPEVLPHMQACFEHGNLEFMKLTGETHREGAFSGVLMAQGLWNKATKVLEEIVSASQEIFEPQEIDSIAASWDLARAYRDSSRLKESQALFQDILQLLADHRESKAACRHHPRIGIDLVEVYIIQARYKEAKDLLAILLELGEQVGRDGAWSGGWWRKTVRTLATIFRMEGNAEMAYPIDLDFLRYCVENKIHSLTTASALSNVAASCSALGDHIEADRIWRDVLAMEEGRENKSRILPAKRDVATGYANLNRFEEAERILREVLEVSENFLWRTHLDTLATMDQLAGVLARCHKTEEAVQLWEECLDGWEDILHKQHPLKQRTRWALEKIRNGDTGLMQEDFQAGGIMFSGGCYFVPKEVPNRDRRLLTWIPSSEVLEPLLPPELEEDVNARNPTRSAKV